MKLTSAKKDYAIYGFMVAVFLAGTIVFFVRYGTSEIWYTLLMIVFLLASLYFFTCTLRFRVMWDDGGIHIRQNWMPEPAWAGQRAFLRPSPHRLRHDRALTKPDQYCGILLKQGHAVPQ